MVHGLIAVALALAPEPPPDLETRVKQLEQELEKLKIAASAEEETPPAPAPSAGSVSPNVFNPTITVVGNGLYRYDDMPVFAGEDPEKRIDRTFNLREVELDFRAAIDPFADGVVIVSFPSEVPGEVGVEVEEAFVTVKRLPIPIFDEPPLGLKLKVGRFRTEVGRMNRLHLHDLPQTDRPLVTNELFGDDGYVGNGLSAQMFLPFFDDESAVELTTQVLAGGGPPVADGSARNPAFVANLRWFRTFANAHNFDLAFTFQWGRPDDEHHALTYGADFLYKWKPARGGEFRSFVLGGQVLRAETPTSSPLGYFAFAQYQLTRNTYLGARWDDTATLADDDLRRHAIAGYLTWYTSEFLRLRIGYQHIISDLADEDGRNTAFVELGFIFGAHPTEPFWVNR